MQTFSFPVPASSHHSTPHFSPRFPSPPSKQSSFSSISPHTVSPPPDSPFCSTTVHYPTAQTDMVSTPTVSDSPASSVNSPVQQLALPSPLTSIIPQSTNIHPMITRSKGGIVKPRVWHAQYKIQISFHRTNQLSPCC